MTAALLLLLLQAQDPPDDRAASRERLRKLSIAELLEVQVYTPGRKDQPLSDVPAAITVLRGEDLRRLGVRSLPDALRYVPGAIVTQLDGSTTAVSIRGFSSRFANKLQVLMDGRSVYTPIFSGVFWESTDTLLEDIDRVEIIRGPGASAWGSNAVSGVINIITKKAKDTTGGFLFGGGGLEEQDFGAARWGGDTGDGFRYRVYAKYFNRDAQYEGHDDWFQSRAGTRMEWSLSPREELVFTGEVYDSEAHHLRTIARLTAPTSLTLVDREDFQGAHAAAWWERRFDGGASLRAQVNLEFSRRERISTDQELWIGEATLTHRFRPLDGHDVSWGASYRFSQDEIRPTFQLSYDPGREHRDQAGLFFQDDITLVPETLTLLAGSWVEYNDHTGLEVQPTARLSLRPADGHFAWASVSRAVRTPSRADDDHRVNAAVFPGPSVLSIFGDRDVEAEDLLAVEAGYRVRPVDTLSLDLAFFHHRYRNLIDGLDGPVFVEADPAPAHTVFSVITNNHIEGVLRGVELTATWDVVPSWRLTGTYALLRAWFSEENEIPSGEDEGLEGDPRHQATVRSSWDLPFDLELDASARFVDRTRAPEMGSWTEMDARLAWRGVKGLEIGVTGRGLLHDRHPETSAAMSAGVHTTEVERAVWAYVGWRF